MVNIIVGIISVVIAIIFGVLSLVTVYPQGRQWLVDTIKKITKSFVPSHHKSLLTSNQIAKYLECKYEKYPFSWYVENHAIEWFYVQTDRFDSAFD